MNAHNLNLVSPPSSGCHPKTSRHSVGSPGHRCSPAHSPLATDGLGCCSVLVSASTRRASTSAPSSHSVKTTGRAAAAAAATIYPANTVLLPAEGYRTGSGGGEREIDREFHASQPKSNWSLICKLVPRPLTTQSCGTRAGQQWKRAILSELNFKSSQF